MSIERHRSGRPARTYPIEDRKFVENLLRERGSLTREQIMEAAREQGLHQPTVNEVLERLVERHEVTADHSLPGANVAYRLR
ncbi:MAG: hypothetical protein ACLFV3_01755 [Phycisphaeraceae bacterium]